MSGNDRCLVALSGGVDSSVALHLLLREGITCIGATMRLTGEDATDGARRTALAFGVALKVLDLREAFDLRVIKPFCEAYLGGKTPNPCVECNRTMKFGALLAEADASCCAFLATGHYARSAWDERRGKWILRKAADTGKDQSYMLYTLTQAQLGRVRFPLGDYTKAQVREIAKELGLPSAGQKDSQDICFVPDGDYAAFVEKHEGFSPAPGDFTDAAGTVLGRHRGLLRYTVGQRRGMGVSADRPLYVTRLDCEKNTVILGGNEDLFSREVCARRVTFVSGEAPKTPFRCAAKIRYRHAEQPCTAFLTEDGTLRVEFDEPQRAATAGQSLVLYDGDEVLGGGVIVK